MILITPRSNFWFTYPHLGIGYIAACLEEIGEKVSLLDLQHTFDYKARLAAEFPRHSAVGITVNVANVASALDVAGFIRDNYPAKKIIMGGPLATAAYPEFIGRWADIVVLGEGEQTIVELACRADLAKIDGIAYWDNGLLVNPRRPYISDLDAIPYPAWHLMDLAKYTCPTPRRTAIMTTSRGCPYDCINCTKFIHGYQPRERSIDNVMAEIDLLFNQFGVREIHFWDDLFTYKPQRVKELCRALIAADYPGLRLAIPAGIRADSDDEEMFVAMRQAGFYGLVMAVESGSQKVLDGLGKRIDLKKVPATARMLTRLGFKVGAFFMLGTPFDTRQTMEQTIDFAKRLKIHGAYFFITMPLPGTKLYDRVEKQGRFLQDMRVCGHGYDDGKAVYEIGRLKARDVEYMFKKAYREFYFRPAQLWRSMVKSLEDPGVIVHMLKQGLRILLRGRRVSV